MIFPVLETEKVVQISDMTRLSATKSFVSKDNDEITKVEICPEAQEDPDDNDWIDVTGNSPKDWFLDWVYGGDTRAVVPVVKITTTPAVEDDPDTMEDDSAAAVTQELSGAISLLSAADDKLFSTDQDLMALEPDILKWVSEGRASFLNVHRAAQSKILEALDESGVVDSQENKLTKAAVVDVSEVNPWSRDMALSLIFQGISNAADDVFSQKFKYYASEAMKRKARAILRLDLNGDNTVTKGEGVSSMLSVDMHRR